MSQNEAPPPRKNILSSPYDRNFEQKCIDCDICMPSLRAKPENWLEIGERLRRPRPSLSPTQISDGEIETFCANQQEAQTEDHAIAESLPIILGKERHGFLSARNLLFTNMDSMVPEMYTMRKPNLYWGAQPRQIDRRVRQDLSTHIVPSKNASPPAAPNFFLELKSPSGLSTVQTRKACYDGALGARAMQALRNYGQAEPEYDNKAYTITCTYQEGVLRMYAHHLSEPSVPGGLLQYHMTPLPTFMITSDAMAFRNGISAFRNARDLAEEQRELLIRQANAVARTQQPATVPLDKSDRQDNNTRLRKRTRSSDTSSEESNSDHSAKNRAKRPKEMEQASTGNCTVA
jgi:hypothetical protein